MSKEEPDNNNLLKKLLRKNYLIDEIVDMDEFQQGFSNEHLVFATETSQYFLKRHSQKFNHRIAYCLKATEFFQKQGIPVIIPIKTTNNKLYFIWRGRYYSLYSYIADLKTARKNISSVALTSLGQMLAKIHLAGKNYPQTSTKAFRHWDKKKFNQRYSKIMAVMSKKPFQDQTDKLFLEKLNLKYQFVQKNQLYFKDFQLKTDHLIHGDYHKRNVALDKNDQVKYVFDFKSKVSSRVLELIRSMDLICFGGYLKIDFQSARVFLDAYNSTYPISVQELKQGIIAHYTKNFYQLWSEEGYYLNNNQTTKKLIIPSIRRLRFSLTNLQTIIDQLI